MAQAAALCGAAAAVVGLAGAAHRTIAPQAFDAENWVRTHGAPVEVYAVDALSPDDAWAVGADIAHFDGTGWLAVAHGLPHKLRGIDMLSADEGWAVGDAGLIMHYDGREWSVQPALTSGDLEAVQMLSSSFGWAVGDAIYEYDGAWRRVEEVGLGYLTALSVLGTHDGWTVGTRIMRLTPDGWQRVPKPVTDLLYGVSAVAPDEAWAVGRGGTILRFDGLAWQVVDSATTVDLMAVAARDRGEAWAVGEGTVLHYDGSSWRDVEALPMYPYGRGMSCSELWAITQGRGWETCLNGVALDSGGGWAVGREGLFVRLTEDAVSIYQWRGVVNDLDVLAADLGWAVGGHAWFVKTETGQWTETWEGRIWRRDGRRWLIEARFAEALIQRVAMASTEAGWAVGRTEDGSTFAVQYQGRRWRAVAVWPDRNVNELVALSPSDVWAIGRDTGGGGAHALHFDGQVWAAVPMPGVGYEAAAFSGPADGWAVGPAGYMAHYDGRRWTGLQGPSQQYLTDVELLGPNLGWASGVTELLTYDGREWRLVAGPAESIGGAFVDLDFRAPDDGWALVSHEHGMRYPLYHFDGTSWTRVGVPGRPPTLFEAEHSAMGDLWVSGLYEDIFMRPAGLPPPSYTVTPTPPTPTPSPTVTRRPCWWCTLTPGPHWPQFSVDLPIVESSTGD